MKDHIAVIIIWLLIAVCVGFAATKPKPKPPRLVIIGSAKCLPCKQVVNAADKAGLEYTYVEIRYVPTLVLVDEKWRILKQHTGRMEAQTLKDWVQLTRRSDRRAVE